MTNVLEVLRKLITNRQFDSNQCCEIEFIHVVAFNSFMKILDYEKSILPNGAQANISGSVAPRLRHNPCN